MSATFALPSDVILSDCLSLAYFLWPAGNHPHSTINYEQLGPLTLCTQVVTLTHRCNIAAAMTGLDHLSQSIHLNAYLLGLSAFFHLPTSLERYFRQPHTLVSDATVANQ